MMLHELTFRRRFSVNLYQSLKLPVGEMSLYKDWVNDRRGDPYPMMHLQGDITESVADAAYHVTSAEGGEVSRLLGSFFPYYTYAFTVAEIQHSNMGFTVCDRDGGRAVSVMLCRAEQIVVRGGDEETAFPCHVHAGDILIATFRAGGVSLYLDRGSRPELIGDVTLSVLNDYLNEDVYASSTVSLTTRLGAEGRAVYREVNS